MLCIDFDEDFASYTPETFIQNVLIEGLGVKHLCVGDDFRFGRNREGDFAMLKRVGSERGFAVTAHDTFEIDGSRVSSGRVRDALLLNDFVLAEQLLGHPYTIEGFVAKGQQLGRTIGYPTANIVLPDILLPINGVFAVRVELQNRDVVAGVANIGSRPTVDGKEKRLEVHLFDFDQDIYDQKIIVSFVEKIRDEAKFDSFEDLKTQIHEDAARARVIFSAI